MPIDDQSCDVVYADQVLEHMSGIDMAREFVNEASRVLRPGGVFLIVVPDYLKEKEFFWDIDYTHNFVTTDRRVRQLLYDGGFEMKEMVRSIGVATGFGRNILAAAAIFVNIFLEKRENNVISQFEHNNKQHLLDTPQGASKFLSNM